jgi:hypothetical protein
MVRKGLLPAHESPWYLYGVREQVGRIASQQYDSYVRIQMAQSPVTNGYDAQAFEASLARWRDEFLDQKIGVNRDPAAMMGFSPRADEIDANFRSEFGATASRNIEAQALEQTAVETRGLLQEIVERDGTIKELGRNLSDLLTKQIGVGVDKRRANDAVLAGVAQMVEAMGNTELFDVLEHVPTSGGNTLANHPMAAQVIQDTIDKLVARERADAKYARWLIEQERKEARHQILGGVVDAATGPGARNLDVNAAARALAPYDPEYAFTLPSKVASLIDHEGFDNPRVVDQLIVQIEDGKIDEGDLIDLFDPNGLALISRKDLQFLRGELERQRGMGLPTETMQEFKHFRSLTGRIYAADDTSPIDEPIAVNRRMYAEARFTRDYRRAVTEGELRDVVDHTEWFVKEKDLIREIIVPTGYTDLVRYRNVFNAPWEDQMTPEDYNDAIMELRDTGGFSKATLDALQILSGKTDVLDLYEWLGVEVDEDMLGSPEGGNEE